jgi:hypothetical protein
VVASLLALAESAGEVAEAEGSAVDRSALAECWLDLVRPAWYDRLSGPRHRYRPVLLRDIRDDLVRTPIPTPALRGARDRDLAIRPVDQRVVAAIVGVPPEDAPA